ncbi:MAG: type II toxin-antitoxin system RelE/ParE family toxin [Magnetococcus sp. YQC-5]
MRIFKNKWFARFAKKESIPDVRLCEAVKELEAGNIDADYGGGVIKQRIAREHAGKSSGYRTVILYRRGDRAFFVYGFPKNVMANIDAGDEKDLKDLSKDLFAMSDAVFAKMLETGAYLEVECDA